MSKQSTIAPRHLVVDADVLASASEKETENQVPAQCREVLEAIRAVPHYVVHTPALEQEWDDHASTYSLTWLVQMEARRRVKPLGEEPQSGLLGALGKLSFTPEVRKIVEKDCHLVEAALATDCCILSKDERAYLHYYFAAEHLSQLRRVMWASPVRPADDCANWVAAGAKPDAKRRIGRRPHKNHPDF